MLQNRVPFLSYTYGSQVLSRTLEITLMVINKDNLTALRQGQKIAFMATAVTLTLAVIKGFIGYSFDSKILIADAFHSVADLVAIFASGFGLWLATKKKSRRFPYGLYRSETLASLLIGIVIVWAGVEILREGYQKLFSLAQVQHFPFLPVERKHTIFDYSILHCSKRTSCWYAYKLAVAAC